MPNLIASFIGINAYSKNPLYGCVRDVLNMDRFSRQYAQVAGLTYQPRTWLAPHDLDIDQKVIDAHKASVPGFSFDEPTFENLRDLEDGPFGHLKKAKEGDICLLYYSGHGSSIAAPKEFWGDKSDRRNETIVCVDSRNDDPNTRDIIDKELAYLIWKALQDDHGKPKKVHCLVIMDCCHSGHNFRDDEEEKQNLRYRLLDPSGAIIPFEQYLGAKEGFFPDSNALDFPIPPYIHLAAARDNEKALEIFEGGLFTTCLLRSLQAGGAARSYRSLMSTVAVDVRNRSSKQNPIAVADKENALDQSWLGLQAVPYAPTYPVRYKTGQWVLEGGGKITGLVESGTQAKTLVRITDQGEAHEVEVSKVFSDYSVLNGEQMKVFADQQKPYEAIVTQLAAPKLLIGIAESLRDQPSLFNALSAAYAEEPPLFYQIDFAQKQPQHEYLIRYTTDGQYVLTRATGLIPLFKRELDAASFLRNVDSVAKWVGAAQLKNANAKFSEKDFVFTVKKVEGVALNTENIYDQEGTLVSQGTLPEEVVFQYVDGLAPAFQLSVEIAPGSKVQYCEIGALSLQSNFKIRGELTDGNLTRLERNGDKLEFGVVLNGGFSSTIPLKLAEAYQLYNINEITAIFKIFVADDPAVNNALTKYHQAGLELDEGNINEINRSRDKSDDELALSDNLGERTNWTVFSLKVRLVGPNKTHQIQEGDNPFSAFNLIAPPGFQANAFAATGDDLLAKQKQLQSLRGTDDLAKVIAPPANLFDQVKVADNPFPAGLNSISNNGIQAIELQAIGNEAGLPKLSEQYPLILRPNEKLNSDENKEQAFILPLGYDEDLDLYYPIGFTDKSGEVIITQLPQPTSGSLQADEAITKDVKQTVKFYFKKVFGGGKPVNELKLHWRDEGSEVWQSLADVGQINLKLQQVELKEKIVLAIHGITGDSAWLLEGLKKTAETDKKINYLLSYDYESIATPIEKTAEIFLKQLEDAGFGNDHQHQLTVVAHSMGGLVTRVILEIKKKAGFIQHLIMVGTPNAGSEVAQMIPGLATAIAAAFQLPGIKAKLALSALFHVLSYVGANPEETLKELKPGSAILKQLKQTKELRQGLQYSLIAGNVGLNLSNADPNSSLKRRLLALLDKLASEKVFNDNDHDLVVTVDSVATALGFKKSDAIQVDSHHIGYFDDGEFLGVLGELL